jgi:hypothetical protein
LVRVRGVLYRIAFLLARRIVIGGRTFSSGREVHRHKERRGAVQGLGGARERPAPVRGSRRREESAGSPVGE